MSRVSLIATACAVAWGTAPAEAADTVYLGFTINATGTVANYTSCDGAPGTLCTGGCPAPAPLCVTYSPGQQDFTFGQDFLFINGVSHFNRGFERGSGRTTFNLIALGEGRFSLTDFSFAYMNYSGIPHVGSIDENFTAPAQVVAVPEPASWALMVVGFGAVGYGLRRQRNAVQFQRWTQL